MMTMLAAQILLVALGGAAGAVARYWLAGRVAARWGDAFPWGTLAVNVSGAGLIGVAAGLMSPGGSFLWTVAVLGVLGSYTTVSSFSLQTLALMRAGRVGLAMANILASQAFCLTAAAAGYGLILGLST